MKIKRGFTLIELLVVISIIGILAGIILVGLNMARDRARDARVKEELANLRAAAEVYNITHKTFVVDIDNDEQVCSDPEVQKIITDIGTLSDNFSGCGPNPNGSGWFAYSKLPSDSGSLMSGTPPTFNLSLKFWCVDSSGFSGQVALGELAESSTNYACR